MAQTKKTIVPISQQETQDAFTRQFGINQVQGTKKQQELKPPTPQTKDDELLRKVKKLYPGYQLPSVINRPFPSLRSKQQMEKLTRDILEFVSTDVNRSNARQMRRKYKQLVLKTHPDRHPEFKNSDVPKLLNVKKQQIDKTIQSISQTQTQQQKPRVRVIQGQATRSTQQQPSGARMTQQVKIQQTTRQEPSPQLKDMPIDAYLKALLGVVNGFITGVEKPDKTLIDFKNPHEAKNYLSYYSSVYDAHKNELSFMDRISLEKLYKKLNSILVTVDEIAELKVESAVAQKREQKQQINKKIKALQANLPPAFKGEIPVVAIPASTTQAQTQSSFMDTLKNIFTMPQPKARQQQPVMQKKVQVQQVLTQPTSATKQQKTKSEPFWKKFVPFTMKPTEQKGGQAQQQASTKPQQKGAQQQKGGQAQQQASTKPQQKGGQLVAIKPQQKGGQLVAIKPQQGALVPTAAF